MWIGLLACAHVPRPYTAGDIREAFVPGLTITWTHGEAREVWRVTAADPREVEITSDAGGAFRAGWVELRNHATFPRDATVVSTEALDTPLGHLACTKYVVTDADGVTTYWFDPSLPGPPVRFVTPDGVVHTQVARALE